MLSQALIFLSEIGLNSKNLCRRHPGWKLRGSLKVYEHLFLVHCTPAGVCRKAPNVSKQVQKTHQTGFETTGAKLIQPVVPPVPVVVPLLMLLMEILQPEGVRDDLNGYTNSSWTEVTV